MLFVNIQFMEDIEHGTIICDALNMKIAPETHDVEDLKTSHYNPRCAASDYGIGNTRLSN